MPKICAYDDNLFVLHVICNYAGDQMVVGVTMVKVVPGEEKSVYNQLNDIDGIKDIFHVFGEYDFVVIMEVGGLSTLNKLVDSIRDIKAVTSTQTIVGAEL